MEKEIVFFTKTPLNIVVATRPSTGSAIIYRSKEARWGIAPHNYYQIISDTHYDEISQDQAQSVYGNIEPDVALLDRLDCLSKGVDLSLDDWIDNLKKNNQIWNETTINGINVPIGYISPTEMFHFYLANDNDHICSDYYALIAGRPGFGKTVMLHNIIVNSCMKYPPDELQLYLADFTEGESFNIYRDLPHVKSLLLSNNKEYALRMLKHIMEETERRSQLYQQAQQKFGQQVTTLASYRKITNEKLPRIMLVMDNSHYLFNSIDIVSLEVKRELCAGIRQWLKFGISVVLSTQSISEFNLGDVANLITYRFVFNLLETDSKSVIRNSSATTLTRKGQTIMNNTANGSEQKNIEFQCSFTPRYLEHVNWLEQFYRKKFGELPIRCIYESSTDCGGKDIFDC